MVIECLIQRLYMDFGFCDLLFPSSFMQTGAQVLRDPQILHLVRLRPALDCITVGIEKKKTPISKTNL
jgi:hypothetical protein